MSKQTSYNVDSCRAFVHTYSNRADKKAVCRIWISDVGRSVEFNSRRDAAKILQRARSLGQKIEKFD
jgi:hypothetical protein